MESQQALNDLIDELPDDLIRSKYQLGKGKRVLLVENDTHLCEVILQNDEDMEVYIDIIYYKLNSRGDPADAIDVYSELGVYETSKKLHDLLEIDI